MIAAIDTQWLAIGVAALVVAVFLVVALVRHRGEDERLLASAPVVYDQNAFVAAAAGGASFLDEPLANGFEGLGRPATATAAAGRAAVAAPEPVDPFAPHDELFERSCVVAAAGQAPPAQAAAQLSDIIVTSEHEDIDLGDPEVRDMLTELMQDEIDLARAQRDQGETLDALLQLTEAEKIAAALGRDDKGAEIRGLLAGLQS